MINNDKKKILSIMINNDKKKDQFIMINNEKSQKKRSNIQSVNV